MPTTSSISGLVISILLALDIASLPSHGISVSARQKESIEILSPNGLAIDARGELYVSDIEAHRILRVDRNGHRSLIAGTGASGFSGDGGPAIKAQLSAPHDLLFDRQGNLLIADSGNHRIRRITSKGIIETIAGDGRVGKTGYNDPPSATSLNYPQSLALDAQGNLYIADTFNHVIRRRTDSGGLEIFAGGIPGFGGDGGPATQAQISLPMAVAVAPDGAVLISDASNSRIRRVGLDAKIETIAGYGPAQDTYGGGYGGDGGPLAKAKLFSATDLKFDAAGNLLIVDSGNHRLRAVRSGIISTIAGTGRAGSSGDNKPANEAELNTPQKIAVAKDGTIYLSDRINRRILRIDPAGVIHLFSGDRP